jgi:hypothetical protein
MVWIQYGHQRLLQRMVSDTGRGIVLCTTFLISLQEVLLVWDCLLFVPLPSCVIRLSFLCEFQ